MAGIEGGLVWESDEDKGEDETSDDETEHDTEEEEKSDESDKEVVKDESPEAGPSNKEALLTDGNKIMTILSF